MYSRYTPRPEGGFVRQQLPDGAELRAAQGRSPPALPPEPPGEAGVRRPEGPPAPVRPEPELPPPPQRVQPTGASRPRNPGPPPLPSPSGLFGPEGLLARLLPRGLDTEDLLILAVLLLSKKQEGAEPIELLIALGLYLWL